MTGRARRRDEGGAVAVLVAVLAVVLFVVAAMVVDLGLARDVRRQSQIAADASALAAANVLYPDSGTCDELNPWGDLKAPCFIDAVDEAKAYAATNFGVAPADWAACPAGVRPPGYSSLAGDTACISFDTSILGTAEPKQVSVVIPTRQVKTGLGAVTGVSRIPVGSRARARVKAGSPTKCSLCFLGPIDAKNADFTVDGGSIHVNGNIDVGPNSYWKATGGAITVTGTVQANSDKFSPAPKTAAPIPDPYASLALPPTLTGLTPRTDPCKGVAHGGGPGYYGDFDLPKSDCNLQPGIYVIDGTWDMKNNTHLKGSGVTLYVRTTGYLDFKNGYVTLSASSTGPLAGFAIVYDRTNVHSVSLQGNGNTSITGVVYAPSSLLDFNGNSDFGFKGGPIVAKGVDKANGNKSRVVVDDATDVALPGPPADVSLDQ